ncbi:hypothetical protein HanXRQr2_Chr09g0377821 [Helianthus annuus]|uniref:Uncharacterized protein n=1 Tax=Helianthus annuus TaxID=4232 RepID=A0A9K3I4T1_HELAN|nr:hypothetical protein HanXRQr2_Chr09g0377821 [Helianthus annuus]
MCWELGMLGLEFSLYQGVIRLDQVVVIKYCFSLLFFVLRPSQRLENLLGKWPVCVVYFSPSWIYSLGWWDKDILGIAEIRRLEKTRVVIWPFWLFLFLVLGFLRLEDSLCLGDIRMDQIFVDRHLFSFPVFVFSPMQRFENLFIGQILVCVVFIRSFWIKGKGGDFWKPGGIRRLKALRVVILLNSWSFSTYEFFHSDLIFYFLGNLTLFYIVVASLYGALTIRATSAYFVGRLGSVLWGCTWLGGIRMEIAIVDRTFSSSYILFVCNFLVHGNGNQTWLFWIFLAGEEMGWMSHGRSFAGMGWLGLMGGCYLLERGKRWG